MHGCWESAENGLSLCIQWESESLSHKARAWNVRRGENESRMWFSNDIWCCLSSGTVHRFGVEETQHLTAGKQLHSFWSDLLALRSFKKMENNMKRDRKAEEKAEVAIGPVWRLWEAAEGQKSGYSRLFSAPDMPVKMIYSVLEFCIKISILHKSRVSELKIRYPRANWRLWGCIGLKPTSILHLKQGWA